MLQFAVQAVSYRLRRYQYATGSRNRDWIFSKSNQSGSTANDACQVASGRFKDGLCSRIAVVGGCNHNGRDLRNLRTCIRRLVNAVGQFGNRADPQRMQHDARKRYLLAARFQPAQRKLQCGTADGESTAFITKQVARAARPSAERANAEEPVPEMTATPTQSGVPAANTGRKSETIATCSDNSTSCDQRIILVRMSTSAAPAIERIARAIGAAGSAASARACFAASLIECVASSNPTDSGLPPDDLPCPSTRGLPLPSNSTSQAVVLVPPASTANKKPAAVFDLMFVTSVIGRMSQSAQVWHAFGHQLVSMFVAIAKHAYAAAKE
jgi:hypothetical protein